MSLLSSATRTCEPARPSSEDGSAETPEPPSSSSPACASETCVATPASTRQPPQRFLNEGFRPSPGRGLLARCFDAFGRQVAEPKGTVTRKVLPLPTALSTLDFAAVEPRQLLDEGKPDAAPLEGASAARSSRGGIARTTAEAHRPGCPCPVSRTMSRTACPTTRSDTSIPPSKVNLKAFRPVSARSSPTYDRRRPARQGLGQSTVQPLPQPADERPRELG